MYCKKCGKEIEDEAFLCVHCGVLTNEERKKPKYYTAGFVLGILSICIPFYGFILGVIGLCLSSISKRKSAIIMNVIGIVLSVGIVVLIISVSHSETSYHSEKHNTVQMSCELS